MAKGKRSLLAQVQERRMKAKKTEEAPLLEEEATEAVPAKKRKKVKVAKIAEPVPAVKASKTKTKKSKDKKVKKAKKTKEPAATKAPRSKVPIEDREITCPKCEETQAKGEEEITASFGWRKINDRQVPQSWCKGCRGKTSNKKKQEEAQEASSDNAEEGSEAA